MLLVKPAVERIQFTSPAQPVSVFPLRITETASPLPRLVMVKESAEAGVALKIAAPKSPTARSLFIVIATIEPPWLHLQPRLNPGEPTGHQISKRGTRLSRCKNLNIP